MKRLETQRVSWNRRSSLSAAGCLRYAGVLAAVLSASYVPTVCAAQGKTKDKTTEDSNLVLEEIVVTVRRRVEMEQNVPISMKAMDAEFLRQQNIKQLSDLGTKVPAVRISNAGTSTNEPIISIRGQRPTDTTLGLDQAAPIYFNEVVMTPSQGLNQALYDLQSVQILKGPQGTLFGRNSTGGAILITSKRPGVDFGGYGQLSYGNYDAKAFEGALNVPVNDALQFRLSGRISKHDGYQSNVANNGLRGHNKFWNEDASSVRLSTNLEVGDLSNLLIVTHEQNDMAGRVPVPYAYNPGAYGASTLWKIQDLSNFLTGGISGAVGRQNSRSPFNVEADVMPKDNVKNNNVSNITEYDINDDLTVKNVFGYRHVSMGQAFDGDGTALPLIGARTSSTMNYTPNPPLFVTTARQFSNEFQVYGDSFDGDLEWITGLYWYDMTGGIDNGVTQEVGPVVGYIPGTIPNPGNNIAINGLPQISPTGSVDNSAYGIFGEATWTFNDQWSTTLGARYSSDTRKITVKNEIFDPTIFDSMICAVSDQYGVPLFLTGQQCSRSEQKTFAKPTGRVSLNYTPTDGMLYYLMVSTGYRAGGFNFRGTDNQSLHPFKDETVVSYELGQKIDWGVAGYAPVRTDLALYYENYSNIQKTQGYIANHAFGTQTVNAASAVINGLEFDVTWAATENLRLGMGYAYTDTYYKNWQYSILNTARDGATPTNPQVVTVDASGGYFTYIPKNTANVSMVYDFPIDLSYGEMSLAIVGYWQSGMISNANANLFNGPIGYYQGWNSAEIASAESSVHIKGYNVWNLHYDWRNIMESKVDLALYVNNATNEKYVMGGLNVIDTLGIAANTYGPPRTYGLSVRYNF